MSRDHVLFNPGPDSVVFTSDGRIIDAQGRGEGNPRSPVTRRLLEQGALLDQGPVGDDDPADAEDAAVPVDQNPDEG